MAASGLIWLEIADFRCFESLRLEPDGRLNLIHGPNASGKTSLLEAMFFLGRGRPLRSGRSSRLARDGTSSFRIVGSVDTGLGETVVGIGGGSGRTEARIGGESAPSLASLAEALPVQIIDPDAHRLVEEGPAERRRYLDWGVFHVEHGFLNAWRRYQRCLRQRNAALRLRQPASLISSWDDELAEWGDWLNEARQRYVAALEPHVAAVAVQLLDATVKLSLRQGWPQEHGLREALDHQRARDQEQGTTTQGPHRADLVVSMDGDRARGRASRGQQKLLAAAALIGQINHLLSLEQRLPVLLVDDPAAELDQERRRRLMDVLGSVGSQLFVTALEPDELPGIEDARRFHVEHGALVSDAR